MTRRTRAVLAVSCCLIVSGCGAAAPAPCGAKPPAAQNLPAAQPKSDAVASTSLSLGWPTWIGIVCEDLEAQRRFYRDVLGLRERIVSVESYWYELDGKLLELFPKGELAQYAHPGVAVGFAVDDVRAARQLLLERGVVPVGGVDGGPNEAWAYFRDADGNLFELVQRPRARP